VKPRASPFAQLVDDVFPRLSIAEYGRPGAGAAIWARPGRGDEDSPPLRSAALKRFCSRPGSSPARAGRRQIWNTCAQSVRDAFVSLWWLRRPAVVR
jgi:hypothetical protein